QCQKCHAIAGAGGQVGPDLTSIGASAQIDYLIESILLPNKAIKENYHSLNVATKDGRFLSGIPIRQTEKELVLRDAEDKEVSMPLRDIEARDQDGSRMPEGLADTLTRAELIHLVRFLSELGKVGPYSPSKARLVRRWQVLEPVNSIQPACDIVDAVENARSAWSPAYSTVAGGLSMFSPPKYGAGNGPPSTFVRFQVEVNTPGKVRFRLKAPNERGERLWVDRKSVDLKDVIEVDLAVGFHTLTFELVSGALRVEVEDVPGSSAR